jgi:hypothetical protein
MKVLSRPVPLSQVNAARPKANSSTTPERRRSVVVSLYWSGAASLNTCSPVQQTLRSIAPCYLTRRKGWRCIAPPLSHSQMGRSRSAPWSSHSQMTRGNDAPWSSHSAKGPERCSGMSFSLSNETERCRSGSVELLKNVDSRSLEVFDPAYGEAFAIPCCAGPRPSAFLHAKRCRAACANRRPSLPTYFPYRGKRGACHGFRPQAHGLTS